MRHISVKQKVTIAISITIISLIVLQDKDKYVSVCGKEYDQTTYLPRRTPEMRFDPTLNT